MCVTLLVYVQVQPSREYYKMQIHQSSKRNGSEWSLNTYSEYNDVIRIEDLLPHYNSLIRTCNNLMTGLVESIQLNGKNKNDLYFVIYDTLCLIRV